MHLFTGHKAIQTEPLNINFIFTDWPSMLTQWSYIYTRLPYLLVYIHRIVEHVCAGIKPTDPAYISDMERNFSACPSLVGNGGSALHPGPSLKNLLSKLVTGCTSTALRLDFELPIDTTLYEWVTTALIQVRVSRV